MENSNYPRDDQPVGGPYPPDKTWGIVIIILSALGVGCGLLVVLGGAFVGTVGAGAAAATTRGPNAASAGALAAGGGILAIVGIGIVILSALRIVAGVGMLKSAKWAFQLLIALSGLSVLLALAQVSSSIGGSLVSIVINGLFIWYGYMRLSGKQGPIPV